MVSFLAKVKIFRFYSPWFVFASPKKVLRKVCHSKGNKNKSLTTLVSVAQHIQVGSYERSKLFIHCTFEWGVGSGD